MKNHVLSFLVYSRQSLNICDYVFFFDCRFFFFGVYEFFDFLLLGLFGEFLFNNFCNIFELTWYCRFPDNLNT